MIRYNRDAAVAYARKYYKNYNTEYRKFERDCANFVSQCLHAGGVPFKTYGGYLWYYINHSSPMAWRGVDSMKEYFTKPLGNMYFNWECLPNPSGLKKGDIFFRTVDNDKYVAGDLNRDVKHVMIVSEDVTDGKTITYCGHTDDRCDHSIEGKNKLMVYLHLSDWIYDEFSTQQYADDEDRRTAHLDFGQDTLKYVTPIVAKEAVKNLQTRLNYLGYDCGTADGKFGQNTKNAVMAFQQSFKHKNCTLAVDGKAGKQTKEALTFPKNYRPA